MGDESCDTSRSSGSNLSQVWIGTQRRLIEAQRNSLPNAKCLLVTGHHVKCDECEDWFVKTALRGAILGMSEMVLGIDG